MNVRAFWNRTKTLIKQRNTTQELTAKACGISINTWYGWYSKGIVPSLEDSLAIAKFLNVSLDYLAAGKERNSRAKIAEI
jgi:transcriptional regulator with XRE-family HTH domain